MSNAVRIIKLGGSLLDCSELCDRLTAWRARQAKMADVIIVGGGRFAEAVRDYDAAHRLDAPIAHQLAIGAMSLSAQLFQRLSGAPLVQTIAEVREPARPMVIFDVARFMQYEEPGCDGRPLPASWDVTSDSIAARAAQVVDAAELVLLKSTLPIEQHTAEQLAQAGVVDAYFAQACAGISSVRLVNLRADNFAEQQVAAARWVTPAADRSGSS